MSSTVTDQIDGISTSTAVKAPVRVATTANITLSGTQTIDGVAVVADDRVLVKSQTDATENGIYDVKANTWTRSPDFDGNRDVKHGTLVSVTNGTTNEDTIWRVTTSNPIIIGTSSIEFEPAIFSDAESISFLQAGASAVERTVRSKLRDVISVKDFGATGDGVTDDAAAFQLAINAGNGITIPDGEYVIASTLTGKSEFLIDCGRNAKIIPTIDDGSKVFDFDAETNVEIKGTLWIDTGQTVSDPLNCVAFSMQNSGSSFGRRSKLDLRIDGCSTGLDIDGFLHDVRAFISNCTLGFNGETFNGCRLFLIAENNVKHFAINGCNGTSMIIAAEGVNEGYSASTIDAGDGWRLEYYFEQDGGDTSCLIVGGTSECRDITLGPGRTSGLDGGVDAIQLDTVVGADIFGTFDTGDSKSNISTTSNSKNIRFHGSTSFGWLHDDNNNFKPALNFFPNPRFDHWLAGWDALDPVSCTLSQETTTVKHKNALKITIDSGATSAYAEFNLTTGTGVPTNLRGKTVLIGGWVFIPDDSYFDESLATSARGLPRVRGVSNNGATSVGSTTILEGPNTNSYGMKGRWNLMMEELAVQSDATTLFVEIYGNNGGLAAPDGTKYIIVGEIFVIDGGERQTWKASNGLYIDSELNPARIVGGKLILRRSAAPTDTDLTYVIGDRIEYLSPALNGTIGEVCTTAGAGGTAVFSKYGPLVNVLSATATLNFDLSSVASQDLTITVTGAALSDAVAIGVPNGSITADTLYFGWVSAADTVTVRGLRIAGTPDPASGTFRATVFKR